MLNNPYSFVGTPTKFAQSAITTGVVTWYTVPKNERASLLDIILCNTTAAGITVNLFVGTGTTTAQAILYGYPVPANGVMQIQCFQVLNADDVIAGSASAVGVTATISGMAQI